MSPRRLSTVSCVPVTASGGARTVATMTGHPADESRRLQRVTNDVDELYELMAHTDAQVQQIGVTVNEHTAQLTQIWDKLAAHDQRFDRIDERFEQVDKRFEQVDKRFDGIDQRLDTVDAALSALTMQVGELRGDVREIVGILKK